MSRFRTLAIRIFLVFFSLLLGLVIVEQVLRFARYNVSPLQIESSNLYDLRNRHIFDDQFFTYDPVLMWRPRPNFGVFNDQGFRGPLLETKRPDEIRIFTIGDSNTLGYNDRSEKPGSSWPGDLQALLRKQNPQITVINAAAYGYTAFQGHLRLHECLSYQPDVVLVSFGANDAHLVLSSDEMLAKKGVSHPTLFRWIRKYRLGRLAWMNWSRMFATKETKPQPRVSVEEYREYLNRMILTARQNKIRIFLLTRPFIGPVLDDQYWKNFAPAYNHATVEVASKQNVGLIDIYTLFKVEEKYFGDESHFTRGGNLVAAQIITNALLPYVVR